MSFYTSLTGLKAATTELALTSNNIANVGTTGFKKSRASFGDIFATSPLQKASSVVGQGVSLKEVRQEFSQGNVEFSSNTLDLAISGEGFFPLKSADGLTDIFTRNGSFVLDEQFSVINSSGQALLAAAVDSSGKADLSKLSKLQIPTTTAGEAKQTSLVELSLNLPADGNVITAEFNRNNPTTYNKSTALSVFDSGGNSYLATIYYQKTANATANSPFNKWQTYVFVGDDAVTAALQQATDENQELLYVNKYGELKPRSEVEDLLVNRKTQKFALDDLTDVRTSVPATITGGSLPTTLDLSSDQGFDFANDNVPGTSSAFSALQLRNFMEVDIDNSGLPARVDLTGLSGQGKVTGVQIADFIQDQLNSKFGDERYFDISTASNRTFRVTDGTNTANIDLSGLTRASGSDTQVTIDEIVTAIQADVDAVSSGFVAVSYDYANRCFKFVPSNATRTVSLSTASGTNALFGLGVTPVNVDSTNYTYSDSSGQKTTVLPNGAMIRAASQQRYGITVSYDGAQETFSIRSGSTGDLSEITVDFDFAGSNSATGAAAIRTAQAAFLGFEATDATNSVYSVGQSADALRGIASLPAITRGSSIAVNVNNQFSVDASNNTFVVSVNDVKGTLTLPISSSYTLDSFIDALQKQINQLQSATGSSVSGVSVAYDSETNGLVFTTGTKGTDSFIKVSGSATWGLANIEAGRGTTTTWIKPTQSADNVNGVAVQKYIDEFGNETASADGFTSLPEWSPIYLDKGELTFNTSGNLVSPSGGAQLDTVFLSGGRGALNLTIDYDGTTQFSQAFAVKSQSQDGSPEGDLVGLDIGDDGLVVASYSNGSQNSLGKIVLVTFPSNEGLRQNGDSSYLSSAKSGAATFGEPGTAGYGTVRAGARERSNVDLTTELVGLITAQRNFQANAKAIETSSALTSTIINIRA
ncbi:MAG: flagellar hook-basal body complex protein [Pseudomonadota bacterium]|nr:flagellar hook-basal body complex protein [Pseudomonadota bacterium]